MQQKKQIGILAFLVFLGMLFLLPVLLRPRGEKVFTIRKNRHYSDNIFPRIIKNGRLDFSFYVSTTWFYDETTPGFKPGWNKLIGISDGLNHHKNSVRIGWRPAENEIINLCAYVYIEGERKTSETVEVQAGWNEGAVIVHDAGYKVKINDQIISFERPGTSSLMLMLYPYFGGRSKAPHDMKFHFVINP